MGLKDPLYPGPTIGEVADIKRRFDPAHFSQIRESAIRQIQNRFQSQVNVDRVTEFRNNYSFAYNIAFKVMTYFIGYERNYGVEQTQGPISDKESQTIETIKKSVSPSVFKQYENEVKEVFNVFQIEKVEDFLKGLDRPDDAWQTFKEILDTGIVSSATLTTSRQNVRVDELERELMRSRRGTSSQSEVKDDWDLFDEPIQLRLYNECPGDYFLIDEKTGKIIELAQMKKTTNMSNDTLDRVLCIDGKYLSPKKTTVNDQEVLKVYDLSFLEQAIDENLRRKTLKEEKDNLMRSLTEMRNDVNTMIQSKQLDLAAVLLMLSRIDKFEAKDFGFIRRRTGTESDEYIFYVRTGQYVLKDFDDRRRSLYYFDPCRIGTRVRGDTTSRPFIIDRYTHPFTKYDDPNQSICIGDAPDPRGDLYQRIIKRLDTGMEVVLRGYYRGCSPYRLLSNPEFSDQRISPNHPKLQSGEWVITNEVTGRTLARGY
jgi:hypothetical protein